METLIKSDDLPGLSLVLKQAVNSGRLGLYRIETPLDSCPYVLHRSPGAYFLVTTQGDLSRQIQRAEVRIRERIKFNDVEIASGIVPNFRRP